VKRAKIVICKKRRMIIDGEFHVAFKNKL